MDSQSQVWLDIVEEVKRLLDLPGARDRFAEQVKQAAAEWLQRFNEKQQRKEERSTAVRRTGVPHGSGRLPAHPGDQSFHWLEDFHDGTPPLEAWLPSDLDPVKDPDTGYPVPIPKRELSLAERYAVLVAVYDAREVGEGTFGHWFGDELSREDTYFWNLVIACNPETCHVELSDPNARTIRSWIAEVESDLSNCQRRGKRSWTQPEVDAAVVSEIAAHKSLIAAARNKQPGALRRLGKKLGRNVTARRLGCADKMVGKSAGWRALAAEFGWSRIPGRKATGPSVAKVGFDIAVEEASFKSGDTTVAEAIRRETLSLFDEALAKIDKEGGAREREIRTALDEIKDQFEGGEIDGATARGQLELTCDQLQDDNSRKAF
jgi:hypothetical protein